MIDYDELNKVLKSYNLPELGVSRVKYCLENPPIRSPNSTGNKNNVVCLYPSRKNNVTQLLESHKVELPAAYNYEFDDIVVLYRSQPFNLPITYKNKKGNTTSPITKPDFLVVQTDGVYLDEWKHADELERLIVENPGRFQKREDGTYQSIPAQAALNGTGIVFRVRPHTDVNPYTYTNWQFLEDYCLEETPEVCPQKVSLIMSLFVEEDYISLRDLLNFDQLITADDIYTLIAIKKLWFASDKVPINDLDSIMLADNPDDMNRFYEGIRNYKKSITQLSDLRYDEHELLSRSSPQQIQKANYKHEIVLRFLKEGLQEDMGARSTVYIWHKKFKKSLIEYGSGYPGLLEKKRGSSKIRRVAEHAYYKAFFDKHFNVDSAPNKSSFWADYTKAAERDGCGCFSYQHTCRLIEKEDRYKSALIRQGKKTASTLDPFTYYLEYSTPRHGLYPYHIGHLDHTVIDVVVVDEETGIALTESIWLSLMIDAFTRKVLAMYMSFDPPSNRSVLMVFRDCVRRNNRYPKNLVIDRGPEFKSVYIDQLSARFYMTKKLRPGGKPTFGNIMERIFGTANTTFFHNLVGNTQERNKNFRGITKEVNPKKLAIWTFSSLYDETENFFFNRYNNKPHATFLASPNKLYDNSIHLYGERKHVRTEYDQRFIIDTLPTAPNSRTQVESVENDTRHVYKNGKIKLWGIPYFHDELKNLPESESDVQVRFDPMNVCHVFAFVKNEWLRCTCEYEALFQHKTQRQLMLASAVLRKRCLLGNNINTSKEALLAHDFEKLNNTETDLSRVVHEKQRANIEIKKNKPKARKNMPDLDLNSMINKFEKESS